VYDKGIMPGTAEQQKFKAFTQRLAAAQQELQIAGQQVSISIDEFRQTVENPPEKKPFPVMLALVMSVIEVVDLLELVGGWSAIYSIVYGVIRLFFTLYLYFWAFNAIDGIKLIGVRRRLLRGVGRRVLLAALSNLPIPYIGMVLRLFPMDLFFIIMTHFDRNAAVQLIWEALGDPKKIDIFTNIVRTKRGPQGSVTASAKKA